MRIAVRMLTDRRRWFTWWALGIVLTVGLTVALWPSVRGEQRFEELVEDLPAAVRTIIGAQEGIPFTSAPGYLHGRLFSTLLPILVLVFGIALGARAVGGAEEDGTLTLVLARPVTRTRVALERLAAAVAMVVALTAVSLVAALALSPAVGLLDELSAWRFAVASAALLNLALLHCGLAFAVGCATGRRGPALAVAGGVAVAGYLLHGLAVASDVAGPARFLSPWHWYLDRNLLAQPPTFAAVVLPVLVGAAAAGAGVLAFRRRDLRLP